MTDPADEPSVNAANQAEQPEPRRLDRRPGEDSDARTGTMPLITADHIAGPPTRTLQDLGWTALSVAAGIVLLPAIAATNLARTFFPKRRDAEACPGCPGCSPE
jgi:hypothetical protein